MNEYDYIIVGAGSAGCVLGNRLSASGLNRVLLLEAGGSDRSPLIQVPLGYGLTFSDPKYNWMYTTEPDPALGGRTSFWPRGKVLGGSSSINAMIYIRGQRQDYDGWADAGNPGWWWCSACSAARCKAVLSTPALPAAPPFTSACSIRPFR